MSGFITAGRKLVPHSDIAFVEPFDPAANPQFHPSRPFAGRLVLRNRDSILIDQRPEAFASANAYVWLAEDDVALNPAQAFQVEIFVAEERFRTARPYAARLRWRDQDGNDQSKLLVTGPEQVFAALMRPAPTASAESQSAPRQQARRRSARRAAANSLHP